MRIIFVYSLKCVRSTPGKVLSDRGPYAVGLIILIKFTITDFFSLVFVFLSDFVVQ